MKIYFAAPMFAKSDLLYNQQLVKEIRELSSELSIYLPQEMKQSMTKLLMQTVE